MTRPLLLLLRIAGALCFLAQGALLLWSAHQPGVPGISHPMLLLVFGLLSTIGLILSLANGKHFSDPAFGLPSRILLVGGLLAQAALVVLAGWSVLVSTRDEAYWDNRSRVQLSQIIDQQAELLTAIEPALDGLIAGATAERVPSPGFEMTTMLTGLWERSFPAPDQYPLTTVIWRGDEKVAWNADAVPFPVPAIQASVERGASWRVIERGHHHWYQRVFVSLTEQQAPATVLELQLQLTVADAFSIRSQHERNVSTRVRVEMASGEGSPEAVWRGSAYLGMQLTKEVLLGDADSTDGTDGIDGIDGSDQNQRLRITCSLPPRQVDLEKQAARFSMLALILWCVAGLGRARLSPQGARLVVACWIARGILAAVDFFRWVPPAFPEQRMPALSRDLASLADPAYFATPFAWGWFASAADGLLTAFLLAGTVVYLIRGPLRRDHPQTVEGERDRLFLAVGFGLLCALVLLGLRAVIVEVADNANARLIGPKLSFRFLTFWALHTVTFLISGSGLLLLTAMVARLRQGMNFLWGGPLAGLIALAVTLAVGGSTWPVKAILLVVVMVLWWQGPRLPFSANRKRGLVLAAILALTVLWNYSVFHAVYQRAELAWLQRKAEQIVQPRDEWIQYLLEDVLQEMASDIRVTGSFPEESGLRAQLWPNEIAYLLWKNSAIRDLGLPCLVEIIDEDGYAESLFASGFLRDFGYEVRERSNWQQSTDANREKWLPITTQHELRRYPTGEERILRGEVMRPQGNGWLRVELPVQSKRISSLLDWLMGVEVASSTGGYRPRMEVDRPLLLLRGNHEGWLDAGPGGFPAAGDAGTVEALQQGGRVWGVVEVDGTRYRCLWTNLPESDTTSPGEGFLLGLEMSGPIDMLLDLSRLLLLNLFLLVFMAPLLGLWRPRIRQGRWRQSGFQKRFLIAYLLLGVLLLLMAGLAVDRLSLQRIDLEARSQTRDGMAAALAQLQSLLAEQATALAESEYIADLLANRLAGDRPLGPIAVQQGMVFTDDGRLLLDETLSDLDQIEATALLDAARSAPMVVMVDRNELYLGTVIPIDLSEFVPLTGLGDQPDVTGVRDDSSGSTHVLDNGYFFYRQLVDSDMIVGLAEIVQGEVSLLLGGEVVLTSNPERVFSGQIPLLAQPPLMHRLLQQPINPFLHTVTDSRLSFIGCVSLPAVAAGGIDGHLGVRQVPAALTVRFPDRERDLAAQREQTVLFLLGLVTSILLTALFLVVLMSAKIFAPLNVLLTATQRLAGGDFEAPLPPAGTDEVGLLASSFETMRDQLHVARDRLAARERFLSTVLNRVPVGVAVFDAEGRIVVLNPVGEQIITDFYPDAADREARADKLLTGFGDLVRHESSAEGELPGEGGRRTLRGRSAPLALPDGRTDTMLVFEDVTEFLANQRLALNAELARQVAHEIKNPLTPIQLSIQLLHQAYCDQAPELDRIVENSVRQVLDQVTLLRSIASEFSLLGRPGELECVPLALPELLVEVASRYNADFGDRKGSGPAVRIEPAEVPPVLGHADSLAKVLGNLMQNSLDAGGGVDKLEVDVSWQISDEMVTMLWQDNGTGLAPEVADRLFDPYFSTKSKGTGLGLAICRNLLDKMNGAITLTNREDRTGTITRMSLPLS